MIEAAKSRLRAVIWRFLNYFQNKVGRFLSRELNNNKWKSSVLEIFLPNNGIISRSKLLWPPDYNKKKGTREIGEISNPERSDRSGNINQEILRKTQVIIIAPKNYGEYPNTVFHDFYLHCQSIGVETVWLSFDDGCISDLSQLKHRLYSLTENLKLNNLCFFDPLAAAEVFPIYKAMNTDFFHNLEFRKSFRLIALLGDIWRVKDKTVIDSWLQEVDRFIHIDNIASRNYSDEVQSKMTCFPFVAFDTGTYFPDKKEDCIVFSGQVRDSDRRYWLRQLIRNSKTYGISLRIRVWFRYSTIIALSDEEYIKTLNQSRYAFSLSQKGIDHFLITARSLQALLSGCVLIQQEGENCKPFQEYLVPFVDYLPYCNESDLSQLVKMIRCNPELLENIGQNGAKAIRNAFPEHIFWNACLG
jgi:hypothetical protein